MADTLPETLQSLSRVREFPFEVIVINDGSSDLVEVVIETWENKFSQISTIRFHSIYQDNGGRAHALNRGAKIASAEYVSFVDADDLIDPPELVKIRECMQASKNELVIGQFKIQRKNGKQISRRTLDKNLTGEQLIKRLAFAPLSPIHLNAFLIKRKFFLELRGMDVRNLKSEDKDLCIRLLRQTKSIQICDSFHYIYRKHNLPRSELVKKRFEWFYYRQKMIRKNFSGMRKIGSMTVQAFFDFAKLFYEGLFKYGY